MEGINLTEILKRCKKPVDESVICVDLLDYQGLYIQKYNEFHRDNFAQSESLWNIWVNEYRRPISLYEMFKTEEQEFVCEDLIASTKLLINGIDSNSETHSISDSSRGLRFRIPPDHLLDEKFIFNFNQLFLERIENNPKYLKSFAAKMQEAQLSSKIDQIRSCIATIQIYMKDSILKKFRNKCKLKFMCDYIINEFEFDDNHVKVPKKAIAYRTAKENKRVFFYSFLLHLLLEAILYDQSSAVCYIYYLFCHISKGTKRWALIYSINI